ncbi:exosortase/archaeosortase family protein [Hymenobacter cavernae]|uniref:Exosortase/archaeosortase family protein n=2 Tax=Hymenobacter cavernae TaxID=2044852 RepID=A0ABQ1TJR1_9BACT|nr:exosortase/archaeosortase family protein [Hymenobacter cavernae]
MLALRTFFGARPMLRFVLTAAALYLGWVVGYEQGLGPDNALDRTLSVHIATTAAALLRGLGFAAHVSALAPSTVSLAGHPAVFVGDPCNGLVLYALFMGFVLAFPGPIRHKLWFMPLGVLAVYSLNVFRVAVLALNHAYWYHTVEFNHHYTFTFVAYGCIFGLWMIWVRRLAGNAGATFSTALQHA